jgi:nitrous oxide reductase accessory protein NosL
MDRNRFARTRYVFDTEKGRFYTCSIACLVILSMKMQVRPENIKVAEYLNPFNMIDAERAVYVIGSKAKGTMTKRSKIAFSLRSEAERFVSIYGGNIVTFKKALEEAQHEILKETGR